MSGEYEAMLRHVRENGVFKSDRTGVGTYSVFGMQARFDLQEGFPLVTTKKLYTRAIVGELIWMLRGDTNIKWLNDRDIHIWDEWADKEGDLGAVYGQQWRAFRDDDAGSIQHIDQIAQVIEQIKTNPDSRRHIVTAWHPGDVPFQALPPCHMMFQFYVVDGKLSCMLYQRSCDMFLGVPFNIASYALLTTLVAAWTGYVPGEFIWTGGDCHIYANHLEQVDEQLSREVKAYPQLGIQIKDGMSNCAEGRKDISDYEIAEFHFIDYNPHPTIKAPVAV